jgi:hypothetical protein
LPLSSSQVMLLIAVAQPPLRHCSHQNEHYTPKSLNSKLVQQASIRLIDIFITSWKEVDTKLR